MAKKETTEEKGNGETKAVATKTKSEVAVANQALRTGAAENFDSQDIALPTVLLMQAKSAFVEDEELDIKSGDFVHSITQEVLGDKKKPLDFVAVYMFKTFQVFKDDEYVETVPWTQENKHRTYDEGYRLVYNYCGYLPSKAREVAGRFVASPIVIKFKGLSKKHCRKQINTVIEDLATFGEASWQYPFSLSSTQETTEEYGKFHVWQAKLGKKLSDEMAQFGALMYNKFKDLELAGKLKADEVEEKLDDNGEKVVKNAKESAIPKDAQAPTF